MKEKHLKARIDQCLRNAELSRCPRRKFGAMLVDPVTNSILGDGYNGPPRGEDGLCAGAFCEREGIQPSMITTVEERDSGFCGVRLRIQSPGQPSHVVMEWGEDDGRFDMERIRLLREYHPVKSGTHMEIGCHHAEANVLANAMRRGIATEGAWLIVTGEPCQMCAKYIHHGGIAKVFVVKGGYAGGDAGVVYLKKYGVEVEYVEGPQDPRNS